MNRAPKSQFERNLHLSTCSLLCTGIDTVEPPRGNMHTHIWMAVWVSSRNLASTSRHVKHPRALSEPFSTECSDEPVDKERSSRIVIHLQNQTMLTLAACCTYSFLIEAPNRSTFTLRRPLLCRASWLGASSGTSGGAAVGGIS